MVHEIDCAEITGDCQFRVASEDEDEVIRMVQDHARTKHDASMEPEDVRQYL